jgi:hypothetical protein
MACLLTAAACLLSFMPAQAQVDSPSLFEPGSRPFRSLVPDQEARHIRNFRYKVRVPGSIHSNATAQCQSPDVIYFGGPVISNVQIVVVYWNSSVNATAQTGIPGFFQGITDSTFYDSLSEYSTNVASTGNMGQTGQSIGRGSYLGAYTIVPSICPATTTTACSLTDPQLQAEIATQIANDTLPAPVFDGNGYDNTLYMVYFPPNITLTVPVLGITSCVDFCSYHSSGGTMSKPLLYSAIMDTFTGACSDCDGNLTGFEGLTYDSSHEMAESVSDSDIGFDTSANYGYPGAWADNTNNCGEIADICDDSIGASVTTPAGSYQVNELWSNQLGECVAAGLHPGFQLSSPTALTVGKPIAFTLTALNPSGGLGTDISFVGTVHFTSSDAQATFPADYTFAPTDQGTADFQVTFQTGPSQTITATDTINSAITATSTYGTPQQEQVTVGTNPAGLAFTIDGTAYVSAQSLSLAAGSSHTIATTSPQTPGVGTQDNFSGWSDSGAISHVVTVPASATTYTASFSTSYLLTTGVSPAGAGSITPQSGSYYLANSAVKLAATSNAGYAFSNWSGSVANAAQASTTVTMAAPEQVTAIFLAVEPTSTTLKSSKNPSVKGESVTFTATVAVSGGARPSGTVTFKSGSTAMKTVALSGDAAIWSAADLPIGTSTLTAVYNGDPTAKPSTSAALRQDVDKDSSTTSVVSSLNPLSYGQTVKLTAKVKSSGVATGVVTFKNGSTVLGIVRLAGGVAVLSTASLAAGTHEITADYGGDPTVLEDTSPVLKLVVNKAATTAKLVSSKNPSTTGQAVSFTATVTSTAGKPTGTVTFKDGAIALGSAALTAGVATLKTSKLPKGADTITASFAGSADYKPSSGSLAQVEK